MIYDNLKLKDKNADNNLSDVKKEILTQEGANNIQPNPTVQSNVSSNSSGAVQASVSPSPSGTPDAATGGSIKDKVIPYLKNYVYWIYFLIFVNLLLIFFMKDDLSFYIRVTALITFFLFFLTVSMGIIRKINNAFAKVIPYHKKAGIFAFVFMMFHIVAVVFPLVYGLNFSGALSYFKIDFSEFGIGFTFGSITLYLFAIVVFTSIGKNMARLGRPLWKKIHYLSYVGFIMMVFHAFNLGTDFNSSDFALVMQVLSFVMLMIVGALFVMRVYIQIHAEAEQINKEAMYSVVVASLSLFFIPTLFFYYGSMGGSDSIMSSGDSVSGSALSGTGEGAMVDLNLTMEEVAKHNSTDDCWVVYDSDVYDITDYFGSGHPGTDEIIMPFCGMDMTEGFNTKGGAGRPHMSSSLGMLKKFRLGSLGDVVQVYSGKGGIGNLQQFGTIELTDDELDLLKLVPGSTITKKVTVNGKTYEVQVDINGNVVSFKLIEGAGLLEGEGEQKKLQGEGVSAQKVAMHDNPTDCWIIYKEKVYDITPYFGFHPGGDVVMEGVCGTDATEAFDTKGGIGNTHSIGALTTLDGFYVGVLTAGTGNVVNVEKNVSVDSFKATPIKGQIPLKVSFSWSYTNKNSESITCEIDYDDGANFESVDCDLKSASHEYAEVGSYNTKLRIAHGNGKFAYSSTVTVVASAVVLPDILPSEVAAHSSKNDCWIIYKNKVYDITNYFGSHPGGDAIMNAVCGTDATEAFNTKGGVGSHSSGAKSTLDAYYVGDLGTIDNVKPVIDTFSANVTSGTFPLSVSFSNSVSDADGDTLTCEIDFGDGDGYSSLDCGSDSSYEYTSAGTRTVTLKVNDGANSPVTSKITITVSNQVLTGLNVDDVALHSSQADCWTIFNNKIYDITPYFGMHPGGDSYLLAICGVDGTLGFDTKSLDGSGASTHSTNAISMLTGYYMGDLNTSYVSSNTLPVISSFTATPTSGDMPLTVSFSNSVSDADGDTLVCEINYGEGAGYQVVTCNSVILHNYASNGIYSVGFRVKDPSIVSFQTPVIITVNNNNLQYYRTVDVAAHSTQGDCWFYVNDLVYDVTGYFGGHPGGDAIIAAVCGSNATVAFDTKTLDGSGSGSHSTGAQNSLASLHIGFLNTTPIVNNAPVVSFGASPVSGEAPLSVSFTKSATDADTDPLTCEIDYGEGGGYQSISCSGSVSHSYANAGTYTANFRVSDTKEIVLGTPRTITVSNPVNTGGYTLAEVMTHNSGTDCWFIYASNVYDITSYISGGTHPGGNSILNAVCGINADTAFDTKTLDGSGTGTHSSTAHNQLDNYFVGPVAASTNTVSVDSFTSDVTYGASPLSVTFTNTVSDTAGDTLTCSVNYGGGYQSVNCDSSFSHSFNGVGTYNVDLLVEDTNSNIATARITINVLPEYTYSQVQTHNSLGDCWVTIDDVVYDLNKGSVLTTHTGKDFTTVTSSSWRTKDWFIFTCGKDLSLAFGGSRHATNYEYLQPYLHGILNGGVTWPTISNSEISQHGSSTNCWFRYTTTGSRSVYNGVYDMSAYAGMHPRGSSNKHAKVCGRSDNEVDNDINGEGAHSTYNAFAVMAAFKIGE